MNAGMKLVCLKRITKFCTMNYFLKIIDNPYIILVSLILHGPILCEYSILGSKIIEPTFVYDNLTRDIY